MARTYLSVNLTEAQQELLRSLEVNEIDIFSSSSIEKLLGKKFPLLNEIIENLIEKDFLLRIENGKYCRANFKDELVIGCQLVDDGCISYWSALNKHRLSEQFPNTIFIQTTKRKSGKTVFGVKYKFVTILPSKFIGIVSEGYGNHSYRITDIEKTIVDSFDLPEYSGGYAELIRAFNEASLNGKKMIEYCKAIQNIAATKRMGFLAELLKKKGMKEFIRYAQSQIKEAYNVFDSQGMNRGEFVKEWRLRLNLSREEIIEICNKVY